MSMLFISHDLGVVGEIADHVVVMRHGMVREQGPVARIFARAAGRLHARRCWPAGRAWSNAGARLTVIDDHIAGARRRSDRPSRKDPNAPVVLEVRSLAKSFWLRAGLFGQREFKAVQGVDFQLRAGPHAGRGRRVGLGQDDDGPDAAAAARADGGRRGALRRPRPADAVATASARRCAGASRSCSRTRMHR